MIALKDGSLLLIWSDYFQGKGWDFFKRGWWLWLLALGWFAGYVGTFAVAAASLAPQKRGGDLTPLQMDTALGALLFTIFSVLLPCFPFVYGAFKATEWKWWLQGLHLGEVRFNSDLPRGALIGNIWKLIGAGLLVSLAVGIPAVAIQTSFSHVFGVEMQSRHPSPAISGLFILSYLALILALGTVSRIYMVQRIWKLVVSSIGIENLGAAEHVAAKGKAASAVGEGLADSLDVAGF